MFSTILLKEKKSAYLYNGESKLITKKKKKLYMQEMHNLGILYAKITLLSSKREEIFFAKELKVIVNEQRDILLTACAFVIK